MGNADTKPKSNAPKVNPVTELQTYIMIVQAKLTQNRNKKVEMIKKKRKEIVSSLEDNNLDIAKAKMDSLIREEDFITVYDILGPLCEILKEKVSLIIMSEKCPDDLRATLDTMVYASTRLEIEELHKIRELIARKYGEIYVKKAYDNADRLCNVNVVEKLKVKQAADQYIIARLKQLCKEEKIEFDFPQDVITMSNQSYESFTNFNPQIGQIPNVNADLNANYLNQGTNISPNPGNFHGNLNYPQGQPYHPVNNSNVISMNNMNTVPMMQIQPHTNMGQSSFQPSLGLNQYGQVQNSQYHLTPNQYNQNTNQFHQPTSNQYNQSTSHYNQPSNLENKSNPNVNVSNIHPVPQYGNSVNPSVVPNANLNYGIPSKESVMVGMRPTEQMKPESHMLEKIDESNLGSSYLESPKQGHINSNHSNIDSMITPKENSMNQSDFNVIKNDNSVYFNPYQNDFNNSLELKNPSVSDKTYSNVQTPGNDVPPQKEEGQADNLSFPKTVNHSQMNLNINTGASSIDDLFPKPHNSVNSFPKN